MPKLGTPEGQNLNFVQRYLFPSQYPDIDNKDGSRSSHRMADAETDGKYVAYPTIIQDKKGKLKQLEDDEAFEYAMQTGEFLEFPSQEAASEYAANGYKKAWGLGEKYSGATDEQEAFDYRLMAKEMGFDPSEW